MTTVKDKQIAQLKLLAVNWGEEEKRALAEGNTVRATRCHDNMESDLAFIKLLETPPTPTGNYTRFGTGIPEQMIAVGPHEAVQKAYYDRFHRAKQIAPISHGDDHKELPPSKAG
jgi:hypothetical protein